MIFSADFSCDHQPFSVTSFWQHLFESEELQKCCSLEKIVVGCEIIAAVDAVELLAA